MNMIEIHDENTTVFVNSRYIATMYRHRHQIIIRTGTGERFVESCRTDVAAQERLIFLVRQIAECSSGLLEI